jgi:hypothetical protein
VGSHRDAISINLIGNQEIDMKFSEKNVRDIRKVLNNHAIARAADGGIKMSAAVLGMATEIGVDRKTLKDFIEGTVAKPSSATMKKFDGWLGENPETVEKPIPTPKEIDDLEQKIRDLEASVETWKIRYEAARKNLQKYSEQIAQLEPASPDHADKYQVVDPENSYWMQNSDAYIKVFTHSDQDDDKMRLFTVPIPNLVEVMMAIEGESHDESQDRLAKLNDERKQLVVKLADQIADLYETCGFPDQYIGVDVVTSRRHIG